jgi:hypothetical protein
MKLFDYETYEDYGKEWFLQILSHRKYALLDFTLQWDDYSGEEWLPTEHDTNSYKWNECIRTIREKLR